MTIARRFRVTHWTHTYKSPPDKPVESVEVAPTFFYVNLLNLTMDGVEQSVGNLVIELDTKDGLTGENYSALRDELISRKLLAGAGAAPVASDDASSLALAKAERWEVIVSIRDGLEGKGFEYMGEWFDSDPRSVARINTKVLTAMSKSALGLPFIVEWTTLDNKVLSMTRDQAMGMLIAMDSHAELLRDKASILRKRIGAAKTHGEVASCVWEGVEDAPASV